VLRPRPEAGLFGLLAFVWLLASAFADDRLNPTSELDRVAYAVDGAESGHGKNGSMWRLDPAGPQGPMQVSEKAAVDVGGGNRFDVEQNRAIGRAYLALLYRRYGNWPDAISAYNWGLGHLDNWIRAGRPLESMVPGVSTYLHRVVRDSGICDSGSAQPGTACETTWSSVPQRSPILRRALARAEALATQFDAEQTRLDRALARSR
jgi:Transglycosylase SLT domain